MVEKPLQFLGRTSLTLLRTGLLGHDSHSPFRLVPDQRLCSLLRMFLDYPRLYGLPICFFNICPFILPKRLISKFDLAGFFFVFFFASFFSSFFFAKPVVDLYTIFDLLEVIVAI